MKTKGFTLAEVLITLTIIGVISAITVPALIQRTNKQEYVSALQKAYSTLSQAANMIIAENGSPKADENGESWLTNGYALYNMFKKYLINAKDCSTSGKQCFNHSLKTLYNNRTYDHLISSGNTYKLILADGVQIILWNADKNCSVSNIDANGSNDTCATIAADINGEKKPNTIGRDIFEFVLKENGLFPAGCDIEESCSNKYPSGFGCTCKVLREGKMDY